ncbi:hypothetical protein HK096_003904, partial [Nowakowskiella sp. JEL0078]
DTDRMKFAALVLFVQIIASNAFYLPGVAPQNYAKNDLVDLNVNTLSSPDTLLPYDYYFERFHFCQPEVGAVSKKESLGSILFGDRLFSSPFEVHSFFFWEKVLTFLIQLKMLKNEKCKPLCSSDIPAQDAKFINARIRERYTLNWDVDGLPAGHIVTDEKSNQTLHNVGFQLGGVFLDGTPVLNNYYSLKISYHTDDNEKYRVVGVEVTTYSISDGKCEDRNSPVILDESKTTSVKFAYSVRWEASTKNWGTRWDNYLYVLDPQIHWFSIINSIVIVLMLTGMIAMILLRALHKDIMRYNSFGDEDQSEDFGWKLVHADVFRPPQQRMFLAVLVGNGVQLFLMAFVTLGKLGVFAALGFLSPSFRGALSTVVLIFYVCFASAAGYVSARLYKMMHGEYWRRNVGLTAFLIPGAVYIIFLVLNFFLIGAQSSSAVPFGTMFALIAMWFLISVPLCVVGAYFGYKHPSIDNPVKTNQIPRQIPTQPLYLNKWIAALIGGILPFGADYNWAWRAFMTAGASGFYVFMYSILYYARRLTIDNFPSAVLYFGWSFVMSILFTILTGSVGYIACLYFVRKIFSSIKVD